MIFNMFSTTQKNTKFHAQCLETLFLFALEAYEGEKIFRDFRQMLPWLCDEKPNIEFP